MAVIAVRGDVVSGVDTHAAPAHPHPPVLMPFRGPLTHALASSVWAGGHLVARADSWGRNAPHHVCHDQPDNVGRVTGGSSGVFVEGRPVARLGDVAETCHLTGRLPTAVVGPAAQWDRTVWVGDRATPAGPLLRAEDLFDIRSDPTAPRPTRVRWPSDDATPVCSRLKIDRLFEHQTMMVPGVAYDVVATLSGALVLKAAPDGSRCHGDVTLLASERVVWSSFIDLLEHAKIGTRVTSDGTLEIVSKVLNYQAALGMRAAPPPGWWPLPPLPAFIAKQRVTFPGTDSVESEVTLTIEYRPNYRRIARASVVVGIVVAVIAGVIIVLTTRGFVPLRGTRAPVLALIGPWVRDQLVQEARIQVARATAVHP